MAMIYVDLSDLSTSDRERIKAFQRHRHQTDSNYTTDHAWVGSRIWRPVDMLPFEGKLVRIPWDDLLIEDSMTRSDTPKPVKILRASRRRSDQVWIAKDADSSGMFCFCFDEVPKGWTYFEIVKVHYFERSVIVRPVVGSEQELFDIYKG